MTFQFTPGAIKKPSLLVPHLPPNGQFKLHVTQYTKQSVISYLCSFRIIEVNTKDLDWEV